MAVRSSAPVAASVTGLDLTVLLLLLHAWVIAVGVGVHFGASGIGWADRRIDLDARTFATLLLLGTVVAWLPLALGDYPDFGALRYVFVGLVLLWGGFYFLGGALANLRSYVAIRRTEPVDAAVADGPAQVTGRVVPLEGTVEAPVTGNGSVYTRLSTSRSVENPENLGPIPDVPIGSRAGALETAFSSLSVPIAEERRPFRLEDGTGRVVVDLADATVRLDPTDSVEVPAGEKPPEPLSTHLQRLDEDVIEDDLARTFHEARIEPGDEVTVLGVARDGADSKPERAGESRFGDADGDSSAPVPSPPEDPTITAGDSLPEFVVAPGCDRRLRRHFRETIAICVIAAVALTGGWFWLLRSIT